MPTHCTALVIHCIDYPFQKAIRTYLEEKGAFGDCDIIAVAGGVKSIVSPVKPSDAEFLLREVETSKKLHDPREVILINHLDCGAYGGSSAFSSLEEEIERHAKDLRAAATAIRSKYPDIVVRKLIAHLTGSEVAFEEVT